MAGAELETARANRRGELGFHHAYLALLAEAEQLPEDTLIPMRTDVATATAAVFAKLEALASLRPRVAQLPDFGLRDYDAIGVRAQALSYADSRLQMALRPSTSCVLIKAQLQVHKRLLLTECRALHARGLLPGEALAGLDFRSGLRKLAANIRQLVVLLREHRAQLADHTRISTVELCAIEASVDEADIMLAQREQGTDLRAECAALRLRMYTLLMRSLAEVRRAVRYFEKKRARHYVPAFFVNRGPRKTNAASRGA